MYFAIGFCGALVCLALFGAGAVTGWQICRRTRQNPAATEARDELDAFRRLQNYTVDDAYGRNQQEG
jgi:hypothetical protein